MSVEDAEIAQGAVSRADPCTWCSVQASMCWGQWIPWIMFVSMQIYEMSLERHDGLCRIAGMRHHGLSDGRARARSRPVCGAVGVWAEPISTCHKRRSTPERPCSAERRVAEHTM